MKKEEAATWMTKRDMAWNKAYMEAKAEGHATGKAYELANIKAEEAMKGE